MSTQFAQDVSATLILVLALYPLFLIMGDVTKRIIEETRYRRIVEQELLRKQERDAELMRAAIQQADRHRKEISRACSARAFAGFSLGESDED